MTTLVSLGTPVQAYLLVERDPKETQTEHGIEIPKEALKQVHVGTVLAYGPKVCEIVEEIKAGSRIMWMYDLPLDADIDSDGPEDIVILDAHDIALILDA